MFELVKQKSTGVRIIMGIIIFAFISLVLRLAFNSPVSTFNDDLIGAANQVNSHAPIVIDSTTRLDRVDALNGNTFQYNYTLTNLEFNQIDTNILKSSWRQAIIEQLKKDPKAALFKDNGVIIQARYVDKNGRHVAMDALYPTEY